MPGPKKLDRSFDAFLSHKSADKPLVAEIGRWLEDEAGLRVWLDEWNLVPGEPWQEGLEEALDDSKCCVVFLGSSGLGPWQNEEMRVALDERVSHGHLRVLPVLLPGASRPRRESRLPAFLRRLTWVQFPEDWKDEATLRRLVSGIRGVAPGRGDSVSIDVCPYRGLEVFRAEDRRFFFGREATVERLLDDLKRDRFLALVGPSGSGKSSVVQAGLLPALDDGETLVAMMTPRERPLEELAFALRRCFPAGAAPPTEEILDRLEASTKALHLVSRELLEAAGAARLFLFVDQFEEIFTQTAKEDERRRFLSSLITAIEQTGPVSVILTLRSDFLGRCAPYPDLNLFVEEHLKQIAPMGRDELERAIVDPAHLVGLVFEEGVVEEILDDVSGSPGELPLLQHALFELYSRRDGARLTLRAYQAIGGIEGALARRADEEFARLSDPEKATLRKMFVLCLVKAGEGTEDTRRRASREELLAVGENPSIAEAVLAKWTDARLLTSRSEKGRAPQIDVAHEALIRKWPRLQEWMADGREEARMVEVLRQGAKEWQRSGRRSDYLFHGARLARAQELIATHGSDLTEGERSFVQAAIRRVRRRFQGLAVSVIFALALAGYLVHDANQSKNAVTTQLVRNYWSQSQAEWEDDNFGAALHFAAAAVAINPEESSSESQRIGLELLRPRWALHHVLEHQGLVLGALLISDESRVLTWSFDGTARLWDAETGESLGAPLEHQERVRGASLTSDESRVLTWSDDGTARLWDAWTGEPLGAPLEHQGPVWGALLAADERRVLTYSMDGTARFWDARTGESLGTPLEHQGPVLGVLLTSDESRVLTWSDDGAARFWDAETGERLGTLLEHQGPVLGALLTSDESRVLTWSDDGTARLWDAGTGEPLGSPLEHQGSVLGALLTSDESRVLTWSFDGTARFWDAGTGESLGAPLEHQGPVWGALLTSDESRVLTWSFDGTARFWDAGTGGEGLGAPLEHQDWVLGALLTSDESRVLTWSSDGTARFWDAETGEPLGSSLEHQGPVGSALLTSDESRVLTWSDDGTARFWDAETGEPFGTSLEHQDWVLGALLTSDESRVLTWSSDGTARFWDVGTDEPLGAPLEHQGPVLGALLTSDESRVLTWSSDGTARFWDAGTGEALGAPLEHQGRVLGALLTSDESRVLTWSDDGAARFWDAGTREALGAPLVHQDWVRGALLTSDGSRVLTWSFDGTARFWDAGTGESLGAPLEHQEWVLGALLTSDESRVLTWSEDGTARLWDAATSRAIGPPFQHQGGVNGALLTSDESRVLTWSDDGTVRLWDIGLDLDFPRDLVVLQARAITGYELTSTREYRAIEPSRWRQIKREWEEVARDHYKVCQYRRHNVWRRFHREEADAIGPAE